MTIKPAGMLQGLLLGLVITGCLNPHASAPPGPPPLPNCSINTDDLYLYTNKSIGSTTTIVATVMRKVTFTVKSAGFPKGANLTYTWQPFPNVGKITGSGKQILYDDREVTVDDNGLPITQVYMEVNVQSDQSARATCNFQIPIPPPPTPLPTE
jgi:hypothetical protein